MSPAGDGIVRHRGRAHPGRDSQRVRARSGSQPPPLGYRLVQERDPRHPHQSRYTGRQVWNRQRKDEALLDIEDVTLGHTTKLRWNDNDKWIFSEKVVHPQLVDDQTFRNVQDILAGRGSATPHPVHRARHPYAFKGVMICGFCERKMQSQWVNNAPITAAPHRLAQTVEEIAADQVDTAHTATVEMARSRRKQVDTKMGRDLLPPSRREEIP